jgi:hypothetical protein
MSDETTAAIHQGDGARTVANDETRCVRHWLLEDPETFAYWREQVRRLRAQAAGDGANASPGAVDDSIRAGLAEQLAREVEDGDGCSCASLYMNLLGLALWAVDWEQVAVALLRAFTAATAEEDGWSHEQTEENER